MPVDHDKITTGNFPVHTAVETGNMRMLAEIVKQGANLDVLNANGDTALILAIISRNLDATRFLVNKGANVNLTDRNGVSPLVHAAIVDHESAHKRAGNTPFFDVIVHSKDYKYNENDMQRINEFDLVRTAPSKSLERVQSNLQKVAAVAEKLIESTKGIYASLMHHNKSNPEELKAALKEAKQEPVKAPPKAPDLPAATSLPQPEVSAPPKPRRQ